MGQYQYGGSSREKAPRPHSRRVSLSDRTRSLTRKLSLFGGSSENLTKMPKSPPNGPRTVVRPRDDYPIYKPKLQARPNDTYQPIRKRTTLTSPYSPYDLDYLLHVTPSDTTMSPLRDSDMRGMPSARSFASPLSGGGRYGPLSAPLLNDIVPEETSEDEDEEEEDPLNHEHPLVQDIRAKEVRFSSTNSGAPLKPTLRELPLRGFRSQENLVKETEPPIKRSSTIHETPTAATSPSIYSTDGRKESTTTQLIDAIAIASMPQRSSVHYTQPTDSAFISPPPIMSATPSPLHFNKPANEVLQPRTDSLEPFRSGQPPQQVTPPRGGSPPLTFATISGPEPDFPYFPSPEPSLHSTAASTIKAEEEESSLAPAALNTLPASPSPHVQDHPRTDYRTRQQAARANAAPLKLFPQADARLQAQMAAPRSPATLGVPHLNDSKHPRSPWKKVFSPFKRKKSKDHENISHFTSNEYVPPDMQSRTSLETNDTRGKSSFEKHNKHIEITPTPIINITTHTPDPNIHNKREQRLSPLVENGLLSKSAITPRSPSPANGSRENIPGFRTAYGGSSAASNALVDKSIGPKRGHRKSRSERLAPLLTMGMLDPDAARRKSEESNRADLSPGGGSGWVRTPGKVREGRPF